MAKNDLTQRQHPLGEALKELRRKKGLKQKQILASMSVRFSERSYRRVEAGTLVPDRDMLLRIVKEGFQEREVSTINQILEVANKATLSKQEAAELAAPPVPQLTRWGPTDGKPPGICINGCASGVFIPWANLKREITERLLPQVRTVPSGSRVSLADSSWGRKDWIIQVLDPLGAEIANVWFGTDPYAEWRFDGLVRIGLPEVKGTRPKPVVWQVFQRYSDGSYCRVRVYPGFDA